jgi:hypothetical protein
MRSIECKFFLKRLVDDARKASTGRTDLFRNIWTFQGDTLRLGHGQTTREKERGVSGCSTIHVFTHLEDLSTVAKFPPPTIRLRSKKNKLVTTRVELATLAYSNYSDQLEEKMSNFY